MGVKQPIPQPVLIVAVAETAGSALYGMVDVLMAAGNIWQTLARAGTPRQCFDVRIVSPDTVPFTCGNGIPVTPACSLDDTLIDDPRSHNPAPIIILPELWLGPDDSIRGRYPELMDWLRRQYRRGASLYSACSGALMLAESGLLDGCPATSHWGYQDLFRKQYPKVSFQPQPSLVIADHAGRMVTAGGTTSWHDLVLHIIARHASPGEALRIAKVYLLKWHGEGQLPYASLVTSAPHADAVVRRCEQWLKVHYKQHDVIQQVIAQAGIAERTLKRRFKAATGCSLMDYVQNLRIEAAKQLLETSELPADDISVEVSYEDPSFFRKLFKRRTGLTPGQYRKMFQGAMNDSALRDC